VSRTESSTAIRPSRAGAGAVESETLTCPEGVYLKLR
jgi:hypothetical protein